MNRKKILSEIIHKLSISKSLKEYILTENKSSDEMYDLSKSWKNFFYDIKNEKELYKYADIIIYIIKFTLIKDFNLIYINQNHWIIPYKYYIKNIYIALRDIYKNTKLNRKLLNIIIKITFNNFNIKKILIKFKNSKQYQYWAIILNDIDAIKFLNEKKNLVQYYKNTTPPKWIFIDTKNVHLDSNNKYLKNNLVTYSKFIQDFHIKSLYTKDFINYINILQNISYKIDVDLFINLFQNINLEIFYKKINPYNIIINNYEEYLINNINDYINQYNDKKFFLNYINKNIIFDASNLEENDINLINESEKDILNFIYNYDDFWITNNLIIDYRGRMYILGAISYISSKLFRLLITFDEKKIEIIKNKYYKYYLAHQIDKPLNFEEAESIYLNKHKYNTNNNIKYNKLELYNNGTITLDATSSMMQIIGLLLKNSKLMKYANVTVSKNRYDIYEYIMNILLSNDNLMKKYYKFIDYFNNKKIYKYCIMLYVYGSSPLYTAKNLIKIHNMKTIHIKDLTTIINIIIKCFQQEFECIKIFKNLIKSYSNLIIYDKTYKFKTILRNIEYSCPEEQEIRIKHKNINTTFKVDSEKDSYEKKLKSSFVNIIHSLDSEICVLTRIDLLEKYDIKTLSIHDCWIIHINNYKKCLECYNNNLKKLLYINIKDIIYNNDISKEEFKEKLIIKYNNYIQNDDWLIRYYKNNLSKNKKYKEYIKTLNIDNNLNINEIKNNINLINFIKNDINLNIEKNINNYYKQLELLLKYNDFNINDFNIENIIYSLKPE